MPDAAARRDALFRETPFAVAERIALGTAWALKPKRAGMLPAIARLWLRDTFAGRRELPDPEIGDQRPEWDCGDRA